MRKPPGSGNAIASLVLGLLPFVLLVPVFKLAGAFQGAAHIVFLIYLCSVPLAAIFAVIYGRRVKAVKRPTEWRSTSEVMAVAGRILGHLGLVGFVLFVAASIIVPRFVASSRRAANQSSAIGSLARINVAATIYAEAYGEYPANLAVLGPGKSGSPSADCQPTEKAACLLEEGLASGRKSSFLFTYVAGHMGRTGKIQSYAVHADPVDAGEAGNLHYFTDQTSVIRFATGREANQESPPLEKGVARR